MLFEGIKDWVLASDVSAGAASLYSREFQTYHFDDMPEHDYGFTPK